MTFNVAMVNKWQIIYLIYQLVPQKMLDKNSIRVLSLSLFLPTAIIIKTSIFC